jgi:hypothetical protein
MLAIIIETGEKRKVKLLKNNCSRSGVCAEDKYFSPSNPEMCKMQPIGCMRAIYICSAARNLVSATLKKN